MIKKGIVSLVCCLFIISFLPVLVFSESSYLVVEPNNCVNYSGQTGNNAVNREVISSNSEVRAVCVKQGNGYYYIFVSLDTFIATTTGDTTSCLSYSGSNARTNTVNGQKYYYVSVYSGSIKSSVLPTYDELTGEYNNHTAYYYTFGDGAGDVIDPINWGILRDVRYDTAVAGSGFSGFRNVDYIKWNNSVDANDNDISECQVEIQAVPGSWTGTTKEDLLTKGVDAFTIGGAYPAVTLATVSANVGTFSISWQGVIDRIGWPYESLYAKLEGTQWLKNGWYYQIRLLGSDGYIGSWQTVYNLTSGSAAGSENIINHNEFNSTTNSYLQTITQINNQETVTITYNDTDITIENPDVNPEPESGTDLWDVLKQIVNGLFQLLAKLGKMVDDLLDGLVSLIQNLVTPPDEIDDSINVEITNNLDNYIQTRQPALYEINQGISDLETKMRTIANNTTGECILTWEPVTIDLSNFGAGTVTFIQGGTHDFGSTFIQFINAFGMTYDDYKLLVSAVIYILLIIYINRKIVKFLR